MAVRQVGIIFIPLVRADRGSARELTPLPHMAYEAVDEESQPVNIPLISQACMRPRILVSRARSEHDAPTVPARPPKN